MNCPSCQNDLPRLPQGRSVICFNCEADIIFGDGESGIWAWFIFVEYKGRKYSAGFYIDDYYHKQQEYFSLYCDGVPVLKLSFYPKINASNFLDKLSTYLLFL